MADNARLVVKAWSAEEDALLIAAVATYGEHPESWKSVASHVPNRSNKACRKRWLHSLSPSVKKTAWTAEEDHLLLTLYEQNPGKWSIIAKKIPGRTDDACSKRYRESLDPNLKKDPWTVEEDAQLEAAYVRIGCRWGRIGQELQRSGLACRNRWRLLRRRTQNNAASGLEPFPSEPASSSSTPLPPSQSLGLSLGSYAHIDPPLPMSSPSHSVPHQSNGSRPNSWPAIDCDAISSNNDQPMPSLSDDFSARPLSTAFVVPSSDENMSNICPPQQFDETTARQLALNSYIQDYPSVLTITALDSELGPVNSEPTLPGSSYNTAYYRSSDYIRPTPKHKTATTTRLSSHLPTCHDPSLMAYACGHPSCWPEGENSSRYAYATSKDLSDHCRLHHLGQRFERPFRCALLGCGKGWKSLNGLQYHLQLSKAHFQDAIKVSATTTVTSDPPNSPLHPPTSTVTSTTTTSTQSPITGTHKRRMTKVFRCEHPGCGKEYKQLTGLNYHKLNYTHTPERLAQLEVLPPALARKLAQKQSRVSRT